MAKITKESVYEEIRKADKKGKKLSAKSKIHYLEQLEKEGEIIKIDSKYYAADVIPTPEEIYEKVEESEYNGTPLLSLEVHVVQHLIRDGKVKKVGKNYHLSGFVPLTQKGVIERLLGNGYLKRSGRKYVIIGSTGQPSLVKVPSFFEFVETLQDIYLRKAREYRQGVSILPLIEALVSEMDISRNQAKKWILELPKTFVGVVDLRPFPGEPGLKTKDGAEVSRIYLERGIVGL